MSTTPNEPVEVGPLSGVRPPQPPDPATTRLLEGYDAPAQSASPVTGTAPVTGTNVTGTNVTGTNVTGSGRRVPRIRTMVLALVMLAISGTVLTAAVADVSVDGGAVALVVLVVAGLLLLGGGLAAAAKEARGGPGV